MDHFEASKDDNVPMTLFWEAVRSIQSSSDSPEFWRKLSAQMGQAGSDRISISEITTVLLLWLREAAANELPYDELEASGTAVAANASPRPCSEADDLPILAQHLSEALKGTGSLAQEQQAASRCGQDGSVTAGYTSPARRCGHHMRSAVLTLRADMPDMQVQHTLGAHPWMRSALLPRCPPNGASRLEENPCTASLLPVSRQQGGLRGVASQLNEDTLPDVDETCAEQSGWNPETTLERIFARSAMMPISPLPSLEPAMPVGSMEEDVRMPILLHIYDVTQEPKIQRLNKVHGGQRDGSTMIDTSVGQQADASEVWWHLSCWGGGGWKRVVLWLHRFLGRSRRHPQHSKDAPRSSL